MEQSNKNANYRKINDRQKNSSTYHKKDGKNIRAILKRELITELKKVKTMNKKEIQNADEKDVEKLVDEVITEPMEQKKKIEGLKPVYILWRKDEKGNIQFAQNGFNKLEIIGLLTIYLQKISFQVHKNGFMETEPDIDIESTGFSGDHIRTIINQDKKE